MTALPSILAGLFIYALWILTLGFERSGLLKDWVTRQAMGLG